MAELEASEEEGWLQGKTGSMGILDIPRELQEFKTVFDEELFQDIPLHRPHDCAINFKEDSKLPKPARLYPMSPLESNALKEYLDKELADGKIRPSESPIAAPCFYVKKADGGLRLLLKDQQNNQ
jgi:hypothetical protein